MNKTEFEESKKMYLIKFSKFPFRERIRLKFYCFRHDISYIFRQLQCKLFGHKMICTLDYLSKSVTKELRDKHSWIYDCCIRCGKTNIDLGMFCNKHADSNTSGTVSNLSGGLDNCGHCK